MHEPRELHLASTRCDITKPISGFFIVIFSAYAGDASQKLRRLGRELGAVQL
jgi:hypothetical protein